MRGLIRYLGRKSSCYPVLFLSCVLISTVLAGWAAWSRLRIRLDVADLLPSDSEVVRATRMADLDFGGGDFLLSVIEIKKDAPAEIRKDPGKFLNSIKKDIDYAFGDKLYFSDKWKRMGPRDVSGFQRNDASLVTLLTDEDFDDIESRIFPAGIDNAVNELSTTLNSLEGLSGHPAAQMTIGALSADPFGMERVLAARAIFTPGPLKSQNADGFYLSSDNQMMLHLMWPVTPSTDVSYARKILKYMNDTRAGLYERHPEWRDAIDIEFSGPHVENAAAAESIRENLLTTSVISLVAVFFLFVVAFRQPEGLLFIIVPLAVGLIWTLGLTSLFVREITQVTLAFAAIIIGLGIDFSIHLYNRYLEDMRSGKTVDRALRNALTRTGPSIVSGAVATGIAFLGMLLTRFESFRQLGLFGSIGIVFSLLAVVLTLPPLMVLFAKSTSKMGSAIATFGLKKVSFTVQAYPRMTVAACLSILVFFGLHAQQVTFNSDLQTLRQPPDNYEKLLERIRSHITLPTNQVLVMVQDSDLDRALESNDAVFRNIESMKDLYKFVAVDSLRLIFPSPKTQRENLQRVVDWKVDRITSDLRSRQDKLAAVSPNFFDPFIGRIESLRQQCAAAIVNPELLISRETMENPLFMDILRSYATNDTKFKNYRILTRVYPPPDPLWSQDIPPLFVEKLSANTSNPPLVLGNARLSGELLSIVQIDLSRVVLLVFASVWLYLFIYFRSYKRAMLALVPVMFGVLSMLGGMKMLGMRLNYLNVIAIPVIIGIAIDSGIHLLERFHEGGKRNIQLAVERTGRAVVIVSLTMIFGFGSLSIANFQTIREIGILAIIGVSGGLFAALIFLPALLRMTDRKCRYGGGPGDDIG